MAQFWNSFWWSKIANYQWKWVRPAWTIYFCLTRLKDTVSLTDPADQVCSLPAADLKENDGNRRAIALQHQLIPRYMAGWKVVFCCFFVFLVSAFCHCVLCNSIFLVTWPYGRLFLSFENTNCKLKILDLNVCHRLTGHWRLHAQRSNSFWNLNSEIEI